MELTYIGNFTQAMKDYAEEKVAKLTTILDFGTAKISYKKLSTKDEFEVEISLDNRVRASKIGDDYYELIVDVVDKLSNQIIRFKKFEKKIESDSTDIYKDEDINIGKEKTLIVESMSQDEAISMMEVLGHDFFIYRDIDCNDEMTVLYRRHDGKFGLIHCK